MSRLLFLFSELSSQFGNNLRIARKQLPPGLHYMTGENADIRENIPNEPVPVVESVSGNIIAIIDSMGYIRQILNVRRKRVHILQRRQNQVSLMQAQDVRQYGIAFNIRHSLPPSYQNK